MNLLEGFFFGSLDGLISTFTIIIACVAINLKTYEIIVIGIANLIGDATGMGLSDFIFDWADREDMRAKESSKRQFFFLENEEDTDLQYSNKKQETKDKKRMMMTAYKDRGVKKKDAKEIVEIMMEDEVFFQVMAKKQDLILPSESESMSPTKSGLFTFFSFNMIGAVPIIPFFFAPMKDSMTFNTYFYTSLSLFVVVMLILGGLKAIITKKKWWQNAVVTLLIAAVTIGSAYGISYGMRNMLTLFPEIA